MIGMLRFVVLIILICIVFAIVRSFFNFLLGAGSSSSKSKSRRQSRNALGGEMFKDPHCGIYVARDLAISARSGKETFYFCSKECRDKYLSVRRQSG